MAVSDGEKLIIYMLADIHEKLGIVDSVDPSFIREHIDADFWAIRRQYSGIFGGGERDPNDIKFVQDVLDMWRAIEASYAELDPDDQERVKAAEGSFGYAPQFGGFDGHTDNVGIARVLIEGMGLWSEFRGRELDMHMPIEESYERMLQVYRPLRVASHGRILRADDLIAIIDTKIHPENRE